MKIVLDDILAKLDPKTRARVQSAVDVNVDKQPTPSIGLNLALKGGLAYGRQILVWGNKSAGKSSFCLQMIALAQKEGKTCAWIDAEHSYDPSWAEQLGVDSNKLIYSPAKTVNDMVDVATKLMDADMTHAVKMLNYANKNTLLVLISQQRNQFGSMHASHIPTGGMAVKFFSSTVVKLWSSEAEANAIKAGVKVGDKIIEQRVGRPVNWIIDYNKVGPPNLSGQYDFYYQGDTLGIDAVGETLDVAEMCGIVEKGGAWYTVNGERFQGRAKAVQYLRDNPKVVEKLQEDIRAKS